MSFPRYPKYKDSGVEWLGEVPEDWDVSRIKQLASIISKGTTPTTVGAEFSDEGVRFLKAENITETGVSTEPELFISAEAHCMLSRSSLEFGDVLVVIAGATTGKSAVMPKELTPANTNQAVSFIRPQHRPLSDYISLWLGTRMVRDLILLKSVQSAQPNLSMEDLGNTPIPVPPSDDLEAICRFLAKEAKRIDELVAEQRRLMELLKEKRQAVISHAVTKGLNPRAPMKPSGIEWLGDVPAHWEVKPLKYLMSLTSGGTPNKENLAYWDGTVPWASSKDLKTDELFDTQDHITQKALDDGAAELVPPGSILTVVRGMILLHTFPVVVARVPMAINQDLKAILPTAGVDADFLAWLLRGASEEVLSRTDEAGHGTKVLRMETWLAMPVAVPPLKEQTLITANIIKQLQELDALAAEAQKAIDLLQERRTALISAAVTGQIDMRKLAAA